MKDEEERLTLRFHPSSFRLHPLPSAYAHQHFRGVECKESRS